MTLASISVEPALPQAKGPLSSAIIDALSGRATDVTAFPVADSDPFGLDLQLALYVCYELHYRGFAGVASESEWDPDLLRLRRQLEERFIGAVRDEVGEIRSDETAFAEMDGLSVDPVDGNGPSYYLRRDGTWQQMREYFVHRSLYHLKEADPHAFAIPRLTGQAKAAFVAVEYDEYGAGRGEHVHQKLYADLMAAADLDDSYLGYLEDVPGYTLAVVNLMSYFGLHRSMRGAAIGHFAATEITSSPGSRRLAEALERLGAPQPCIGFYREHVEADAVHEQVVRTDVVGALIATDPQLEQSVIFGMRALDVVENRWAQYVLASWAAGRSSLCRPLA
jgi:hypothetical protein